MGNGESQRCFGDEGDAIAEVRGDARRGFTALLGAQAADNYVLYLVLHQPGHQAGVGQGVMDTLLHGARRFMGDKWQARHQARIQRERALVFDMEHIHHRNAFRLTAAISVLSACSNAGVSAASL